MKRLKLPTRDGRIEPFDASGCDGPPPCNGGDFGRIAFAAAHAVADPLHSRQPWDEAAIDWDATMAYRRHLWSLGFGVAEAMDTAQRGMGLSWTNAAELIRRSTAEAKAAGGAIVCGVGTDQLDPVRCTGINDVASAYETQLEHVERCGGRPVIMASRALCRVARGADDYLAVYGRLIEGARNPVILHWLGTDFDPQLKGYWGSDDVDVAMRSVLALIESHRKKIDGIKISLLQADREVAMRAALPPGVRMYTGDDFNYPGLIEGDGEHHSHALLGIFDPIAPVAAPALKALAKGQTERYHDLLGPTVRLSRRLFEAPTHYYKTGVVFLAWLAGHQSHFRMIGGMESARGIIHLADIFRLAVQSGLFYDIELATARMIHLCALSGIEQ
ncbi:MAG: dihydrodipicolinate synthase family protein [Roseitalea sp.]|jgi:hypothetical protein|nr:dihydrodipicolinate synthase family protein [Roseitalea sp.]MBO6721653.1 dihydrodipicolinate synthase family protein [Roseitalea sp.]MBO6743559.1 dihydrodipicolinate synthase family protein [Roseitalea sp.]